MTRSITFRAFRGFLFLMCPTAVIAAQSSLGDELNYSNKTLALIALLICAGGFTGLLHRLKQEYEGYGELRYPKIFVASNLCGAFTGGVCGLLLGTNFGLSGSTHAVFIIVCSYAGVLLLEQLFDSWAEKYMPVTKKRESEVPKRRATDFERKPKDELPKPPVEGTDGEP